MAESQSTVPPLKERPLVTFALFAYNQEKYIREAVAGAFAQTYEPLEIILSDDCSTDRTFEIMEEMSAAYRGPHRVRAVRNAANLGVVPHVLLRGKEAQGRIVIVAAGDDISLPERTVTLIDEFNKDARTLAVTSAFDLINDAGNITSRNNVTPIGIIGRKRLTTFINNKVNDYTVIQGSTASYRKQVFDFPLPDFSILFSEDNLFNFAIYANGGKVVLCKNSLIMYRTHDKALSNRVFKKHSLPILESESAKAAIKQINKIRVFQWIAKRCKNPDLVDHEALGAEFRKNNIIHNWPEYSITRRLALIFFELFKYKGSFAKWQIARIFGGTKNYQPKGLISRLQKKYE